MSVGERKTKKDVTLNAPFLYQRNSLAKESFQVRKVPGHSDFFYKYSLTIFLPIHNASTF